MPMLLLAREEGLTGPYVLQTATTQQEQMRALAGYAVHTLGFTRLGVLYPDDTYGRSFANAFRDEATRLGAARSQVERLSTRPAELRPANGGGGGVGESRRRAGGLHPRRGARPRSRSPPRPARRRRRIQLLGTESWNQPDVLAAAGKGIDGAVFADSFFVGSGTPSTADFVSRFRAQNGYDPSGFEAQAYDAGMLVREAIAQGARTRGAVLQYLRAVNSYQGASVIASGAAGLKPDLVLLQVRDGRVATVSR